jgi:predicted XRE-type DNA-binding protein
MSESELPTHSVSGGNVFADIGVADPELALAKAKIVQQIDASIQARGLTQKQAGALLGLDQSNLSRLLRGRVREFTLDRLMKFLNVLDFDVEILLTPSPDDQDRHGGRIDVVDQGNPRPLDRRPRS